MSIITNADGLDPAVKKKLEAEDNQIEHLGEQIGKRIAETKTEGVGSTPVQFVDGRQTVVTRDQIRDERKEYGAPVIPIGYDYDKDNRVVWKLSPYHYHMVLEGRVCHACLEWQSEVISSTCTWRGKTEGCGAERIAHANTFDLFGRK